MKILINLDCLTNHDSVATDFETQLADSPQAMLIQLLRCLSEEFSIVVYTTIPEEYRLQVEGWLIEHDVPADEVLMRTDYSKNHECILDMANSCDMVHTVIERNVRVVEALRENDFHVLEAF